MVVDQVKKSNFDTDATRSVRFDWGDKEPAVRCGAESVVSQQMRTQGT